MAEELASDPWNADPINHGWLLWRQLVETDDARHAIGALLKDDLRCIVLAQVLEERQVIREGPALARPVSGGS
jgi:hypothetical protein